MRKKAIAASKERVPNLLTVRRSALHRSLIAIRVGLCHSPHLQGSLRSEITVKRLGMWLGSNTNYLVSFQPS